MSSQVMGTTGRPLVLANVFELRSQQLMVLFSASSLTGEPRLSYQDRRTQLSFSGEQIRIQETEIGTLVSVTLESIPDLRTVAFTLVLPAVRLVEGAMGAPVRLPALRSTSFTTIAGPGPGQETIYRAYDLAGVARHLVF